VSEIKECSMSFCAKTRFRALRSARLRSTRKFARVTVEKLSPSTSEGKSGDTNTPVA
jgi:hypothetical protein